MKTPMRALAWEILARRRTTLLAACIALLLGTGLIRWQIASPGGSEAASVLAYTVSALVLTGTFSCFHFTEGSRRGGFGGFPTRLFHLPVGTGRLVATPMLCGAAWVTVAYLACALLLLRPLGHHPPMVWPCLYLVSGMALFQTTVWTLASRPACRLFVLGSGVACLATAWMFFLPDIYAGTLSDWGYSGDPDRFMAGMLIALALSGPLAFLVSRNRIDAQRHRHSPRPERGILRALRPAVEFRRRFTTPFRSPDHALFWHEFRRTGWILPGAVLVLLVMTGLPTALGGDESGRVTAGVVTAMVVAPVVLAMMVGCGLAKPDFWSTTLRLSSFQAALPVTSGQWVRAKLLSAFVSASITWLLTLLSGFLWVAWFGNLTALEVWWYGIRFYYSPGERLLLALLGLAAGILLTWRFLVSGLHSGLSGRVWLRRLSDALTAGLLALAFGFALRHGDSEAQAFPMHRLRPWMELLPFCLPALVIAKMSVAAVAWDRVCAQRKLPTASIVRAWIAWLLGVAVLSALVVLLCTNTVWLRNLLLLGAILALPLARTAMAILALAGNRSSR